jgi:hypothetical protein
MAAILAFLFLVAAPDALDPSEARDLLSRILSEDEARRGTARAAILRSRDRTLLPALWTPSSSRLRSVHG